MSEYKQKIENDIFTKIEEKLGTLPSIASSFIIERYDEGASGQTVRSYFSHLTVFFEYLKENKSKFKNIAISDIRGEDISNITQADLDGFSEMLLHEKNTATTKHYAVLINLFLKYAQKHGIFDKNSLPVMNYKGGLHKEKQLSYLTHSEQLRVIKSLETGENLSSRQAKYNSLNRERDLAIMILFITSGITVSELVGIDIDDVDFNAHSITITRTGQVNGYETIYISDRAEQCIRDYLETRDNYHPYDEENALFLSRMQRKTDEKTGELVNQPGVRISEQCVRRIVVKYADAAVPEKAGKITPQSLRASFAKSALNTSSDPALTQSLLGLKNISSVSRYFDAPDDTAAKKARNIINL